MTALPDIKARATVQLPPSIQSGLGVSVAKTMGRWKFSLAYDNIQQKPSLPSIEWSDSKQLYWNETTGEFTLVPYINPSPRVTGTSTTSAELTTGTQNFSVETGIGWVAGMRLRASNAADPTGYMEGVVTSYDYDTGALELDVDLVVGSGTVTSWAFGVAGEVGEAPPPTVFDTAALAGASSLLAAPDAIQTRGYDTVGDLGGALYKKNGTTSGQITITLRDGTTQVGYDVASAVLYTPEMFGLLSTDTAGTQRTKLQFMIDFAPENAVIDLGFGEYTIDASLVCKKGQEFRRGQITLDNSVTTNMWGMFCAADNTVYRNIILVGNGSIGTGTADSSPTPLYHVGINSGSNSKFGRNPAKNVQIIGCNISNLTVGVFLQPDSTDPVPSQWWIERNYIHDIVGKTTLSEGYGITASYGTDIFANDNVLRNIKRHAIYFGGVDGAQICRNIINFVDNVAIQLNGYSDQPSSYGNMISGNRIANVTRSVDYGYNSSVGIGVYGFQSFTTIEGNSIIGVVQIGIDAGSQSGDATITGSRISIIGNDISLDSSALVCAIGISNYPNATIKGNSIRLASAIYGIVVSIDADVSNQPCMVSDNTITTSNASAVALRTAVSHANGQVFAYRNQAFGFTSRWSDTSSAGVVKSDFNSNLAFYGTDADATHNADGPAIQDAPVVELTGARTAARTFNLSLNNVPPGAEIIVSNKTSGGFVTNINSGTSTLLTALAANESAICKYSGSAWRLAMKGAS